MPSFFFRRSLSPAERSIFRLGSMTGRQGASGYIVFRYVRKKYELKLLTNFLLFAKFVSSEFSALFDLFSPAHKVRKVGFAASPIKENSATFGSEL